MNNSELVKELLREKNSNVSELAKSLGQTRQNLSKKLKRDTLTNQEMNEIAKIYGLEYRHVFAAPIKNDRSDVLNFMTSNFHIIYELDVNTKNILSIKNESKVTSLISNENKTLDYDFLCEIYLDNYVFEDDRAMVKEALRFENVLNFLKKSSIYKIHFRVLIENKLSHYELKCTTNGTKDSFDKIYLGISCEEDDYLLMEKFSNSFDSSKNRKLLIVGESEEENEILKEMLEDEYELSFAKDGEEGFNLFTNGRDEISLLILNVDTENLSGEAFLKRVKGDIILSNIPIIVSVDKEEVTKSFNCLELGASDFVTKPYNKIMLKNRINTLITLVESKYTLNAVEFDEVTGLYNKEAFVHHVEGMIKGSKKGAYDVMMADIEHFSRFNRQYGMSAGNEVLRYFAKRVKNIFPNTLYSSRLRDDVFAIIVSHVENFDINWFMETIAQINTESPLDGLNVKYGLYLDADKTLSPQMLIDRCQWALETIYNKFGSNVAFFDDEIIKKRVRENYIENSFNKALRKKEFEVKFQPKFYCADETLSGAEALVRWNLDGNVVSPGEFIPIFERNGSIGFLDEYVFKSVVDFQSKRMKEGKSLFPISVNLSRVSVKDEKIAIKYGKICKNAGIDPKYVPIEITESFAVESKTMKEMSKSFFKEGFQLYMDDFGSGYSSLSGIHTLQFDMIKLDKSLIDYIGTSNGESLIRHTIKFIHESKMKVIAEGVESENQLEFLKSEGCDEIQGFYYFPPLSLREFEDVIEKFLLRPYDNDRDHVFRILRKRDVMGVLENEIVSEELVSNIVGPVALIDVYDDGRIMTRSCNLKLLEILGTDSFEHLKNAENRNARLFIEENEYERFERLFSNAVKNPIFGFSDEFKLMKPDKTFFSSYISAYYLRKSRKGNLFYCYFHDNKENTAIGKFLDGINMGYLICKSNDNKEITYSNECAWHMLGCETENEFMKYVNGSYKGVPCPKDSKRVNESLNNQTESEDGSAPPIEYKIKRKDGSYMSVVVYNRFIDKKTSDKKFLIFIVNKDLGR